MKEIKYIYNKIRWRKASYSWLKIDVDKYKFWMVLKT